MKTIKVKHSCQNCEFNMGVCAGKEYGKEIETIKEKYPNGCEEWNISYEAYSKYCDEYKTDDINIE